MVAPVVANEQLVPQPIDDDTLAVVWCDVVLGGEGCGVVLCDVVRCGVVLYALECCQWLRQRYRRG